MANTTAKNAETNPEDPTAGVETVKFKVTLANGKEVDLEGIAHQEDMDLEMLEHAERGNYATFLMGALTPVSLVKLKRLGAKVRDFETISIAYGEANGSIESEDD